MVYEKISALMDASDFKIACNTFHMVNKQKMR